MWGVAATAGPHVWCHDVAGADGKVQWVLPLVSPLPGGLGIGAEGARGLAPAAADGERG